MSDGPGRKLARALSAFLARIVSRAGDCEQERLKLQQRDALLSSRSALVDIALNTMSQGLCVFDADQRVVVANRRYAELYSLTFAQVQPGTTLKSILEARAATGVYNNIDAEKFVRDGIASFSERVNQILHLADGRVISVVRVPMPDGGIVSTHEDITEREKLSAELAAQNERLAAILANVPQGICLFDSKRRVIASNAHYAEMYRLASEDVKPGTHVRKIVERRIANGLYAGTSPQDYLRERSAPEIVAANAIHRLSDGRTIAYAVRPLPDGGGVATHEDITEREQLSAQLAAQNERLDAALDNMLQGLAMFDAEQRLIVCNRRYSEMYGLSEEQVAPGTTVREILAHRLANGTYHVSDDEAFVESWAGSFGEISMRTQELADGRIISVSRRIMPNGGRLVTHEDITERQKLSAQLERQHELLKNQEEQLRTQNMQLDAALNNMVQGLAMFDPELRLIVANARYAEMYGLTLDQVKPGTSLRQIVELRIANGHYAGKSVDDVVGEICSRMAQSGSTNYVSELSDGRSIAVSAQRMADGGTVTTHQDITEQRRSEAKIVHMALHDTLTDLPNRVLLNERLEHALSRMRRGEIVATHMLDLDHFKHVNDTLGHPAGDQLLKMVATRLRALVRDTDTVARMGGDEFAILQVAISSPADATSLAHRLIDVVGKPYEINGHHVVVGTSVGIAVGPSDGTTPDQLMRNADLALYRAKGDGRGTFRFFEPDMDAQMQARRTLECDLRRALTAGEFELYYQPVVSLATDEISGFEALIRWHHPTKGLVAPGTFIPLAEEIGLIVPIGEWVIREACKTAAQWPDNLRIAVNLSPAQFRHPGLPQVVTGALAASGLPPGRLELEITETVLLADSKTTTAILHQLRGLGVRIAMDDFGTGYSSLSYLQSFPFDKIKIDRSFVRDIAESAGSLNIVRAVAALANGLGMAATAEGVETKHQLDTIRSEGCTEMQGFLFSQPIPAKEVEQLLHSNRSKRSAGSAVAA